MKQKVLFNIKKVTKFCSSERGEAVGLVLLIVLFPLLMTVWGLAFDLQRNFLIKTTLQSSLDQGAVAGASVSEVDATGTKLKLIEGDSQKEAINYYMLNAKEAGGAVNIGTPVCDIVDQGESLQCTVTASSKNMWGGLVGLKTQTYNIVSYARLNDNTANYVS